MAYPQTSFDTTATAPYAGMKGDSTFDRVDSYVNEEASAEMEFGIMLQQGTLANDALIPTGITNDFIGVLLHSHAYANDTELGTTGLKPNVTLNVMSKGRCWVTVEEAVTPASNVLVRCVTGTGTVMGRFRDTADGVTCLDISAYARFLTSTSGAGVALLEFDITNRRA